LVGRQEGHLTCASVDVTDDLVGELEHLKAIHAANLGLGDVAQMTLGVGWW